MAAQVVTLTQREREVAALVARGKTNQEIADDLDVALQTVKNHVNAIFRQIGAKHRAQVAVWVLTGIRPGEAHV